MACQSGQPYGSHSVCVRRHSNFINSKHFPNSHNFLTFETAIIAGGTVLVTHRLFSPFCTMFFCAQSETNSSASTVCERKLARATCAMQIQPRVLHVAVFDTCAVIYLKYLLASSSTLSPMSGTTPHLSQLHLRCTSRAVSEQQHRPSHTRIQTGSTQLENIAVYAASRYVHCPPPSLIRGTHANFPKNNSPLARTRFIISSFTRPSQSVCLHPAVCNALNAISRVLDINSLL